MKWRIYILSLAVSISSLLSVTSCTSQNTKSPASNSAVSNKSEEDRQSYASIPKDSLIALIRDIAEYISEPNTDSLGFAKSLATWQKKYKLSLNGDIDDISLPHISYTFSEPDVFDNGVIISQYYMPDSSKIKMSDLSYAFGNHEKGIFDNKIPQPKEPGKYVIYTIHTKLSVPVYMNVKLDDKNNIYHMELKKYKHFFWLQNK